MKHQHEMKKYAPPLGRKDGGRYHIFMTERYKPQQGPNETWTVIDAQTERAAEMGSRTIIGMNRQDAEEIAELLNILEAQKQRPESDPGC
jgi:hypothetical protein